MGKSIKILLLTFIMMTLSAVVVSAANIIDILDNGISEINRNVTVKISTENFSEGDDVTLLVFKPTNEKKEPDITNIVAIDQTEYKDGITSITFTLPEDASGLYEVRIGGTNVSMYTSGTFNVMKYSIGDVNGDGIYDDKDAILILRVYLELDEIDLSISKDYYDLNGDGVINVKDAALVYQMKKN